MPNLSHKELIILTKNEYRMTDIEGRGFVFGTEQAVNLWEFRD